MIDIKGVKEWVIQNNLEERTFKGFWNAFNNYQVECFEAFKEDFRDYDDKNVSLFVDTVSFTITNWPDEDYNHVVISIRMQYKGNEAGMYRMVFNLSGEVEDDYLTIY